jgi:hypothetical protein
MDPFARALIGNFMGVALTLGALTLLFAMSFGNYHSEPFSWKWSVLTIALLVAGLIACAVALSVIIGLPPALLPPPN